MPVIVKSGKTLNIIFTVCVANLRKGIIRQPFAARIIGTDPVKVFLRNYVKAEIDHAKGDYKYLSYSFRLDGYGVYEIHNGYRTRSYILFSKDGYRVIEGISPSAFAARCEMGKVGK